MTAVATSTPVTTEDRLRTVLRVDAVVTGLAGLFAIVGPTSMYGDVPGWLPRGLGAAFVLAALLLAVEARATGSTLRIVGTLCMEAAFAWVVASIAILELADLPAKGEVLVGLVGLATLAFGVSELRLLRALRRA